MGNQKLSNALTKLRAFATFMVEDGGNVSETEALYFVYDQELQREIKPGDDLEFTGFGLDEEGMFRYRELVDDFTALVDPKVISRTQIEGILQTSIQTICRTEPPSDAVYARRLETAIATLQEELRQKPRHWTVHVNVTDAVLVKDEAVTVGRVQFAKHSDKTRDAYIASAFDHCEIDNPDRQKRISKIISFMLKEGIVIGSRVENTPYDTVAYVNVDALDVNAAIKRAIEEVQEALDVVAFSSDGRFGASPVYPRSRSELSVTALASNGSAHRSYASRSARAPFLLDGVNSQSSKWNGLDEIQKILLKPSRSAREKGLLAAYRWAGRAAVARTAAESFLFYCVALEALLLTDKGEGELTYRISIRLAHLSGKDARERRRLKAEMTRLYGLRSKIVHVGKADVADIDLVDIRNYAIAAIVKVARDKEISRLDDLAVWFEDRLLQ